MMFIVSSSSRYGTVRQVYYTEVVDGEERMALTPFEEEYQPRVNDDEKLDSLMVQFNNLFRGVA